MKKNRKDIGRGKATGKSRSGKRIAKRRLSADVSKRARLLEVPSTDALARIESIPLLFTTPESERFVQGSLAQDSWAQAGVGLRDVTDGHVRRLQFAAGKIQFELVAERRARQWEFIGRIYRDDAVAHDFVLVIGSRRLLPNTGGFFSWSSEKVARRVRLISQRETIAFEDIVW